MKENRWALTVSRLVWADSRGLPVASLGAMLLRSSKGMANATGKVNEWYAVRRQSRGWRRPPKSNLGGFGFPFRVYTL
jgi:hypothetical protein